MHTNKPFIIFLIIIVLGAVGFFGTYLIMYVAFHSRAVAVRKVVPNPVLQIGELNVASMRTLRYALGIRHPPRILTWTFDAEGATLWGAHPKAGPVLRIEKNQTLGLIPIEVYSKGYYPGIGIRLVGAASGEESGIGWIVRDPDRPIFPKKQERVRKDLTTLRTLWGQEDSDVDWNDDTIPQI